ncbi:MAG TPA: competence protein CoiA family protein [Candidatus Omnitrophota bacterium]|nr:competence protein CoiA family protein [Candidatus Omnitrophota bacterium]
MKFALVNGVKTEAQPGLKGICLYCEKDRDMIAKCGKVKIWHWAHKSNVSCDPWWENEREWHRAWKNRFPVEWQENRHVDSTTGEKHIADIKTAAGLVIEFQHSAIQPAEVQSREAFYKNMVWVIDGTRLKGDFPSFCKGFRELSPLKIMPGVFLSLSPNKCFPASWLNSSVPIYFDFQGVNPINQTDRLRDPLWCLFPGRAEGFAVVAGVPREDFIKFSAQNTHLLFAREMLSNISQVFREKGISASRGYPKVAPCR